MSVQGACKGAGIIALTVVVLSAVLTAGTMLFLFGATLAVVTIGVIIAVAVVMAVLEEILSWFKKRFPNRKPKPAQQ